DITPLSGLSAEIAAWWSGSFVDHDRDGELDLVLTRIDGDPLLYRGLGAGRFEEIVGAFRSEIVLPVVDNKGPVWFDYDLDGDEDLYVAGMSSARLFRNDGAGLFVDVSAELLPPEARRWVFAASAADLDQDGDEDLYLGCWSNQDYVLVNEGGTFSMQGPGLGLDMQVGDESHENTMGLTIGDIDGDGFPDVLIGPGDPSFRGPPIAYCHEGVGLGFRRCSEDFVAGHGSSRNHGASLGDPDHDGDVDIFWNLGGNPPYDTETGEDSTQLPAYYVQQGAPIATTVSVRLRGTESNVEALGASIRIEGGSTRWLTLHSTQGFPNQPSPWRVLSLSGASTGTLTIRWPSGRVSMRTVSAFERIEIVE
ncbi:MAG: VCBS repeat-containing protein, partial [Myxococcales bacterium]|nr:VCBS repeat-containing protein [Myxococcales bacterium]